MVGLILVIIAIVSFWVWLVMVALVLVGLVFVCLSFFGLFGFEQFRFGQTSCDRFCFVRLVLGLIGFGWTDLVFV